MESAVQVRSTISVKIRIIIIKFKNIFNTFESCVADFGLLAVNLRIFSFVLSSDIESGILITTTLLRRPDPWSVLAKSY